MLCEGLIGYMMEEYKNRFQVYEKSPVTKLDIQTDTIHVQVHNPQNRKSGSIAASDVILCTNGYHSFEIGSYNQMDIKSWLNTQVQAGVGYMVGYATDSERDACAISYISRSADEGNTYTGGQHDAYYYVTDRQYTISGEVQRLISIGGPEKMIPIGKSPEQGLITSLDSYDVLKEFVGEIDFGIDTAAKPLFQWNGVM
jgi:hypothetical protein